MFVCTLAIGFWVEYDTRREATRLLADGGRALQLGVWFYLLDQPCGNDSRRAFAVRSWL